MIIHDYLCKKRHKIFYLYACYHSLSAFLSFHVILSYNLKMLQFRANYDELKINDFITYLLEIISGF